MISLYIILSIFANVGYFSTFNALIDIFIEHAWIWDVLYCLAYILLAGALFWYNKLLQTLNKKIGQSIILNKKQFKFLWEKQNMIFIHLNQDINVNSFLATYSTNSNIIHHFSFFFANLISLSELREQSTKI